MAEVQDTSGGAKGKRVKRFVRVQTVVRRHISLFAIRFAHPYRSIITEQLRITSSRTSDSIAATFLSSRSKLPVSQCSLSVETGRPTVLDRRVLNTGNSTSNSRRKSSPSQIARLRIRAHPGMSPCCIESTARAADTSFALLASSCSEVMCTYRMVLHPPNTG